MTREEAIRIIDQETTCNALGEIEYFGGFSGEWARSIALCEALSMAAAALREQETKGLEIDTVKPLTIDELREMDGEPVWLMGDDKFYIVNNDFRLPWGKREPCGVDMWGAGTSLLLLAKCGLYRHKPKEV